MGKQVLVDDRTYDVVTVREGGMGRVWLLEQRTHEGQDPIYRRRIAVKTFDLVKDERAVEHELNVWILLDHPSVLPLKKIGRLNYRLAAIMPWLTGSLDALLEERGSLPEHEVVPILADVADGLEYAWSTFSLLHLDLKPSNVLVETKNPIRTRIADWGISRLVSALKPLHARGSPFPFGGTRDPKTAYGAGTPLFMAPERFSGHWTLSPTADIFSLGMMAVEMNTGVLPFRLGPMDPVEEVLSGLYFRNVADLLRDRSPAFQTLCLACTNPNAAERPTSFREVSSWLRAIQKGGSR